MSDCLSLLAIFIDLIQDITISYPLWFLLLVPLIGMAYAAILYVKNKKLKVNPAWRTGLFLFRFLSASLLAFLLLSPLLKSKSRLVEKPVIIITTDNSKSMLLGSDSNYLKANFEQDLKTVSDALNADYRVDNYLFGEQVRRGSSFSYQDTYSDYAGIFSYLKEEYAGVNVGALIVVGDGISNRGIDPEFALSGITWPLYGIAVGDTSKSKDLLINDVRYNSIVYLDDNFPLEVNVSASGLKNKRTEIEIYAYGKKVAGEALTINTDNYNKTFRFLLKAEKNGRQRISVGVKQVDEEVVISNNTRNVFLEVLDNRQKALILAHGPHPDIGAIKSSLESNRNYEVVVEAGQYFRENINEFDLVILYQIPTMRSDNQRLLNELKEKEIPVLLVLGKQSNLNQFDSFFPGLSLKAAPGNTEEAQLVFNPAFL